jgi:hypothetical protein
MRDLKEQCHETFIELFIFVIDSPVVNTPGSQLESLDEAIVKVT